jgi:hypothetical protein
MSDDQVLDWAAIGMSLDFPAREYAGRELAAAGWVA